MSRSSPVVPAIVTMAVLLSIVVAFASLLIVVTAEATQSIPDDATLLKMKVKDLKAILEKKGQNAACIACTSKQEYISRIHETRDWPDIVPEPESTPGPEDLSKEDLQKMFTQGQDDERVIELKKKLEALGIDTSKIFSTSGVNRDELLKEREKLEKIRDSIMSDDLDLGSKDGNDNDNGNDNDDDEDDAKSDL